MIDVLVGSGLSTSRRLAAWVGAVLFPILITFVSSSLQSSLKLYDALPIDLLFSMLAVVGIAMLGGVLPAMLTTISSVLLTDYFYTPPLNTLFLGSPLDLVALGSFGIIATVVGILIDRFVRQAVTLRQSQGESVRLAAEQSALRRVATRVAHGDPPDVVFCAVAEEGGHILGATAMLLMRYDKNGAAGIVGDWTRTGPATGAETTVALHGDEIPTRVWRSGHSTRLTAGGHLPAQGAATVIGTPIVVERSLWGILLAAVEQDTPPNTEIEEQLADFADLVGTTIASTQAKVDLAASRARIVAAGDEIRRRIGRDLHDGTQQRLVSLMLKLRNIAQNPAHSPELRDELRHTVRELDATLDEVRRLSHGIHPAVLTKGGLSAAIETLTRRSAIPVETDLDIEGRLPPPIEVTGYYIVAEALTNAVKHADASVVRMDVVVRDRCLHIRIQDDGRGGADPDRGSGLIGITDRVESLGGTLTVSSPPGAGTTLTVELPVDIETRLSMSTADPTS